MEGVGQSFRGDNFRMSKIINKIKTWWTIRKAKKDMFFFSKVFLGIKFTPQEIKRGKAILRRLEGDIIENASKNRGDIKCKTIKK